MPHLPQAALIIVGHGSTLNPDSSQPTYQHAETIRQQGGFGEIACAFWKEEPSLREVLGMVRSRSVFVVPNFISEGYFTQEVIPRELRLTGKTTQIEGQTVHYCDPVGIHPSMTKLLLQRADDLAPGVPRDQCSLIIVGHGTGLNDQSTKAIKDQVAHIQSLKLGFTEVLDAYMEEPPLVADWASLTTAPHVLVVPFFIADGLHSFQDIPVLLGIEAEPTAAASQMAVFRQNPHHLQGRSLYYSSAIGTEPMLAEVIVDQVEAFIHLHGVDVNGMPEPLEETIIQQQYEQIGEILIRRTGDGISLLHVEDASNQELLEIFRRPADALEIAKYDEQGAFRPLKSAPTLRRGWIMDLASETDLLQALDYFYPAALANWRTPRITPLRETLQRQTGMYRVTGLLTDDEAHELVETHCCDAKCLRKILWPLNETTPLRLAKAAARPSAIPLNCVELCNLVVAAARTVVKSRKPTAVPASP